jgi:methylenetetrahydrofolate reductase (NADPH)
MKRGTVDEVLTECKRLGIRNILALRGDEPRESEYALDETSEETPTLGENKRFGHAVDLIRYIREEHGDYFCIAAAAYPEGHPTQSPAHPGGVFQSPEHDLPHLIEKVEAGADFLLTQLFYDVEKYTTFVDMLRNHPSGLFDKIPIIPGMMPAQGWQSFSRTIKLARVGVPQALQKKFQALRGDDEGVKNAGVECLTDIVNVIKQRRPQQKTKMAQGFHFYTLNLEKAVAQVLEKAELLPVEDGKTVIPELDDEQNTTTRPTEEATAKHLMPGLPEINAKAMTGNKRRASSTKNRVVVSGLKSELNGNEVAKTSDDYVFEEEAGKPRSEGDEDQLAIAEGEGSLGRAAAWDDFPNGRWGDARSPGTFCHPSVAHSAKCREHSPPDEQKLSVPLQHSQTQNIHASFAHVCH